VRLAPLPLQACGTRARAICRHRLELAAERCSRATPETDRGESRGELRRCLEAFRRRCLAAGEGSVTLDPIEAVYGQRPDRASLWGLARQLEARITGETIVQES